MNTTVGLSHLSPAHQHHHSPELAQICTEAELSLLHVPRTLFSITTGSQFQLHTEHTAPALPLPLSNAQWLRHGNTAGILHSTADTAVGPQHAQLHSGAGPERLLMLWN